jgi:glycerol-3-phosphate acyltransferase PlsX
MATVRVALDAMGGDNAPSAIVAGGVQALENDAELELVLVGREDDVERCLQSRSGPTPEARSRISVVNATEVVEMDEHPANAVRVKKDSSINVGARLVGDGRADAFVSAGNSGGIMAAALFGIRRLPGVDRPAIGAVLPTKSGRVLMLDAGANTDVKPEWLAQFALLGDAYARRVMGVAKPRVFLLSNGEEEGKGNQISVAAYPLLKDSGIDFRGNVEGKEMFNGVADVVVTDGFTGNVALKSIEGSAELLLTSIRDEAKKTPLGILGGLLLKPSIANIRARADWRKIGGAPLLGVEGVCVIAHGRSDAEATKNAVLRATEAVRGGLLEAMREAFAGRPAVEDADPAGMTDAAATEAATADGRAAHA